MIVRFTPIYSASQYLAEHSLRRILPAAARPHLLQAQSGLFLNRLGLCIDISFTQYPSVVYADDRDRCTPCLGVSSRDMGTRQCHADFCIQFTQFAVGNGAIGRPNIIGPVFSKAAQLVAHTFAFRHRSVAYLPVPQCAVPHCTLLIFQQNIPPQTST